MLRPFPLKGRGERKVKKVITAQRNFSRDSVIAALKTKRKTVAQFMQTSLSLNISYTCWMCTRRHQSETAYSL